MEIRRADVGDIEEIMRVYRAAQDFMIESGNPGQWGHTYPALDDVEKDIENGFCHVLYDTTGIHAVCALCTGGDPYYEYIEGSWLNDNEYVAIHRIAGDGTFHGIVTFVSGICKNKYRDIRADTHGKNLPMRRQLEKNGFVRCGTVYVRDGTARIAYHWSRDTE